jgi:hypothetical protein
MPRVDRQGQAHIVSTAIPLPRSGKASREVEATLWFRAWFSIDPQPASISPTINISIVFICAILVDCGRIICHSAIKNDSSAAFIFAESDFVNAMEAQTESGVVARMMSSRSLAKPSRSQILPGLYQAQAK